MNACTIVAWNYLAHARVLARSFLSHHPKGRFSVLLLDDRREEFRADEEEFQLVRPQDIMEPEEFDRLSLVYDVTELATAVKPWLMSYLLSEEHSGPAEILFFDPDIQIFTPLNDIAELARRYSIVLTPHTTEPMPRDWLQPSEIQMLQAGAYNLGFIALGVNSVRFLAWWRERLRLHCLASPEAGLFVDQKWIDFVPGYFDHHILKDPGCNVAYWNLASRNVSWDGARYRVNEGPLRFFHFSGFAPEKPHVLSRHSLPAPRILLSQHPMVKKLCDEYAKELFDRGYGAVSRKPYGLSALANGLPIDRRMRRIYREALLASERGSGDGPPLPNGDPDAFVRWLNEPFVRSSFASVSRYLYSVYSDRTDLKTAFPDLAGRDGARFLKWVRETGVRESEIPGPFLPSADGAEGVSLFAGRGVDLHPGVNVVGYFRAEMGVGEAARQLVAAIERAGVPHATLTVVDTTSRQDHPFQDRSPEIPYDLNIVCVNADALSGCAETLGREFFEGRYTIGVWHWEVPSFPERWHDSFQYVDEIWVASEHAALALSVVSPKPVHVVPPPVTLPPVPSSTRGQLGIPDRFTFLFIYDFLSVCERKNPLALVEAFKRAFAPGEGPVLVLKSINGDQRIEALERVKLVAAEHPDVLVLDRYLSREATIGLTASCDCYVSLHRAEGFGLTMAEAMALGKPVIATGYSGNLAYMRNDNAYLVRYRLERIPEGFDPYAAGGVWAEPDVEHAAELMRHVHEHPEEALERGRRAREDIRREHSLGVRAERIGERLAEIRRQRRSAAPSNAPVASEPEATPKAPSGASKHERAHTMAREFPGSSWETTSRFRPALPMARAALLRLLRPYTASLQTLHAAMLEDALELRERFDRHERERVPSLQKDVADSRAALLQMIRETDRRVELLTGQTVPAIRREAKEGHGRAVERLWELEERVGRRLQELLGRVRLVEEDLSRSLARHKDVERHLAKLTGDVTGFQDAAKAHLASLTARIGAFGESLDRLRRELHALPYSAEPFRVRMEDGAEGMEYRRGEGETDDDFEVYSGFEAVFRGPEAFVRDRLRPYLDIARAHQPVVDVGCGRGEFLDLLAESGVSGAGVDILPGMVERCRKKGHRVERADAVDYLAAQREGSIGCIFSAHFIEHLPYDALLTFLRLAQSKLVPGGVLVAETVNPHSVAAMKHFWIDLSHQKPIFPEVALTLCRLHGFGSARIVFPRGGGRLEDDLWEQGEYAVVASRDRPEERR